MVRDNVIVTMESLWETTITLSNGSIADPYHLPVSSNRGSKYTTGPTSPRVLVNMIKNIDMEAVRCAGCQYKPSDVACCQITFWFSCTFV